VSTGTASAGTQKVEDVRHRLSIERLVPDQVKGLRRAFEKMQAVNGADERSYNHHAGIHGLPLPFRCKHGTPLFLPWHRAYLYFFELDMRDRVPELKNFAIPWWNWTSDRSHEHGIPDAYSKSGKNPLRSGAVDPKAVEEAAAQGVTIKPRTSRQPSDPAGLPTKEAIDAILDHGDFLDFSSQLEDVHGSVHVWVGGHMSDISAAAFDPIFWAHHAMIDRIWRLWQVKHPSASVPPSLLNRALAPFPMTVAQTIDMTSLGYDYAVTRQTPHAPS
jgi:tyrosinase